MPVLLLLTCLLFAVVREVSGAFSVLFRVSFVLPLQHAPPLPSVRVLSLLWLLLKDQAVKDKALQSMASMSSAQIVSATAIHNKLGLPGIPRPAFPGAGVRALPAPRYWSILSSFTQGSDRANHTKNPGQITLHTTALHNCPYQISTRSKGVVVKITTYTEHGAKSHSDLVTNSCSQLDVLCCLFFLVYLYI